VTVEELATEAWGLRDTGPDAAADATASDGVRTVDLAAAEKARENWGVPATRSWAETGSEARPGPADE
jgi:hypothetical protein